MSGPRFPRVVDGLVALARRQETRPWAFVGVALLICAASLPLVRELELRGDLQALLPEDRPSVVDMHAIQGRFGVRTTFTIAISSDDRRDVPQLKRAAEAFVRSIEERELSTVRTIDWNVRPLVEFVEEHAHLYARVEDLREARDAVRDRLEWERARANPLYVDLEGEPPADVEALRARFEADAEAERARRVHDPDGFFLHGEMPFIVVFLRTSVGTGDAREAEQLLAEVQAIETELRQDGVLDGLRVDYGGDTMDILEEVRALVTEVAISIAVTMALLVLVVWVFYREVRAIPLLALALVPPIMVTFGLAEVFIGFLNTSTAFLGSIIIGNGVNPMIMWLSRYFEARRAGESAGEAIATAHRTTWAATLTASLAAAVAYGALVITDFRGFRDFGIIGAIGMVLCWVGAIVLLPALAMAFERVRPLRLGKSAGNPYGVLFAWLALRAPRVTLAIALVVSAAAAVLAVGYVRADPLEYDFRNLQSERDPNSRVAWVNIHQGEIVSQAATGSSIAVLLPDAALVDPVVEQIDRIRDERPGTLGPTRGVWDLLPADQDEKIALLREIRRGMLDLREHADADVRATIDDLLPPARVARLTVEDLPEPGTRMFREVDGTLGRVLFVEHFHGMNSWDGQYLVRWADAMRALRLPDGTRPPLSGHAPVFADLLSAISEDGPKSVAAALAVTAVLVFSSFRRRRERVLALAALFAGVLWMVGAMAAFRIKLNFLNFVAFPVTFGIGADYAVNYLARFVQEEREHGYSDPAIRRAVEATGGAIVLCCLTTLIGYISLYASSNKALNSFGAVMAISELTCVAAAIVALPALLAVRAKRGDG